jgi:hypothetical protein
LPFPFTRYTNRLREGGITPFRLQRRFSKASRSLRYGEHTLFSLIEEIKLKSFKVDREHGEDR